MSGEVPQVEVRSRGEWRAWLEANHGRSGTIWLVTWKKGSPFHVPMDALIEEALAFGWIDSLPRKLDAARTMVRMSPRKPGSAWSGRNKAAVAVLEAEGRMAEAGRAAIARAKQDGSWERLDGATRLEVPADLAKAFAAIPGSAERFAGFPPSARRATLEWIAQAKRPDTRQRRVETTAQAAADGRRVPG